MDLINYNDLPDWYKDNEYIKTGYRKVNNCVYRCCESVLEIHNETTNIWTHLLGAVQFLILCVFTLFDDLKLFSRLSLSFFCLTVALCFALSTMHHTFICHSHEVHKSCILFDYLGIAIKILGTTICGLYAYFYDTIYTNYFIIYSVLLGVLLSIFTNQLFNPNFYLPKHRAIRTTLIMCIVITSSFIPSINAGFVLDFNSHQFIVITISLYGLYLMYSIGGFVYVSRFPEAYFKLNFDYIGNSHNIMHVFIILGATIFYFGIRNILHLLN